MLDTRKGSLCIHMACDVNSTGNVPEFSCCSSQHRKHTVACYSTGRVNDRDYTTAFLKHYFQLHSVVSQILISTLIPYI